MGIETNISTDIKDKQLKVISHYGMDKQLNQLVEECAELTKAICKYKRDRNEEFDLVLELIEEMADVKNLIEQIELNSDFIKEGIEKTIISKVDRELGRISKKKVGGIKC